MSVFMAVAISVGLVGMLTWDSVPTLWDIAFLIVIFLALIFINQSILLYRVLKALEK